MGEGKVLRLNKVGFWSGSTERNVCIHILPALTHLGQNTRKLGLKEYIQEAVEKSI